MKPTNHTAIMKTLRPHVANYVHWYLLSVGVIIFITGAIKVISFSGHQEILFSNDPIFGFSFRYLMLSVGIVELIISAICFLTRNNPFRAVLVAWLATGFLGYRVSLWCIGWHGPCGCLGHLTDAAHISPNIANTSMKCVLCYLLVGSYTILLVHINHFQAAKSKINSEIRGANSIRKVCLVVFLGIFCSSSWCMDFKLIGDTMQESFKADGSFFKRFPGHFTVVRSGTQWMIEYSPDGSATTEEIVYDGTNTYCLTRNIALDKEAAKMSHNDVIESNGIVYGKSQTAIVFEGQYPFGSTSITRFIWFAFLSSQASNDLYTLPAPWGASYSPESRSFIAKITWSDRDDEFAQSAKFIASGDLWTNSFKEWKYGSKGIASSPFNDGFVGGMYQVFVWTNLGVAHAVVPSVATLDRLYPGKVSNTSVTLEKYTCQVESAQLNKKLLSLPELGALVNVLDYRFESDVNLPWFYIVYSIKDGKWKMTNDPSIRSLIGVFKTNYFVARTASLTPPASLTNRSRFARIATISLIIAVSFVPPTVLWYNRRGRWFASNEQIESG